MRTVLHVVKGGDYFKKEMPREHDPLTKRGRRRVVYIRKDPAFTTINGMWRLVQRDLLEGFRKALPGWGT